MRILSHILLSQFLIVDVPKRQKDNSMISVFDGVSLFTVVVRSLRINVAAFVVIPTSDPPPVPTASAKIRAMTDNFLFLILLIVLPLSNLW